MIYCRENSVETQREVREKLRGNTEGTLRGYSAETQRELRGNSGGTQRKLSGNSGRTVHRPRHCDDLLAQSVKCVDLWEGTSEHVPATASEFRYFWQTFQLQNCQNSNVNAPAATLPNKKFKFYRFY